MEGAQDPVPGLADALEVVEDTLLGARPHLTRREVADRAGLPIDVAEELWRLLGFAHAADDDVAFTAADVEALSMAGDLMRLGILSPDSQAALVRTWGRSFARLAEWQTRLLADVAVGEGHPAGDREGAMAAGIPGLAAEVLPRVEALQSYAWRRHLAAAASRMLAVGSVASPEVTQAVCFVDIVGYTSRSKDLSEAELVDWLERFEGEATLVVVERGGRVIKTIGDEVLFVADDPVAAAESALELTARGADPDDPFPEVRAGLAYGGVVARLGDVFGPVVNVASRLTSLSRPGRVLVDAGAHEALSGPAPDPAEQPSHRDPDASGPETPGDDAADPAPTPGRGDAGADGATPAYRFRRLRRASVKGYSRLPVWVLRRDRDAEQDAED